MKAKNYTQKEVIREARRIQYSLEVLVLKKDPRRSLDLRYNFDKDVLSFIKMNAISEQERQRILNLRKERRRMRDLYTNILGTPLVMDYRHNKGDIHSITYDRIIFHGRNHWAKDERDRKILQVLKKFQNR